MKRVFLILIIVFVAILATLVSVGLHQQQWAPNTSGAFVGYVDTNGAAPGTNALFVFHSIPQEETSWRVVEISRFNGTNWQAWAPLPDPSFTWAVFRPTNAELASIVPLQSTTAPVRVVIQLTRNPGNFLQELRRAYLTLRGRGGAAPFEDPRTIYRMTNYAPAVVRTRGSNGFAQPTLREEQAPAHNDQSSQLFSPVKRTLYKGILSAAVVAACVTAWSQNVYSLNVGSFPCPDWTSRATIVWHAGPVTVDELDVWTDTFGHAVTCRPRKPADTLKSNTWVKIGALEFTLPMSPPWAAFAGITLCLLGLACVIWPSRKPPRLQQAA